MELHDFRFPDAGRYRNVPEAQIVGFLCSPFELADGRAEPELAAMQVLLDRLVAIGLPFRPDAQDTRRFDLAEVVNFIKHAHYAWGNPVWRSGLAKAQDRPHLAVRPTRGHVT